MTLIGHFVYQKRKLVLNIILLMFNTILPMLNIILLVFNTVKTINDTKKMILK